MRSSLSAPKAALATLAVAALVLTGCGRDDTSDDEGPGASAAINDEPATGTLDVWAMGTEGEELEAFSAAFLDENPDVELNVTAVPWEAAHDKLANAISSGETPDVSLIGTTWMGEFAKAGGLDPTPEGLVDEADFFEGPWQSTVVGDTSYGVPWYVETRVLFYRTDLAKEAGWDEAPQSWDDLKQFATDLQDNGAEYGISLPPGQTGSWQTMLPFAWSNGASVTNDDGTEYTIDSPEMTEALEYYKTFFDDKLTPDRTLDPGELETGFAKGTYGSFISGPWHVGLVEDAGLTTDEYAVAPMPGKDSGMGTSFVGGGDLAVFKDAENRDAAWKFVRWLSEPDVQQEWYSTISDLPAVQEAWETGELADDPQLQVFGTQLEETVAPPAVPTWEEVAAVIDADVEKAVKGAMPVPDSVTDMQSQAERIGTGL